MKVVGDGRKELPCKHKDRGVTTEQKVYQVRPKVDKKGLTS